MSLIDVQIIELFGLDKGHFIIGEIKLEKYNLFGKNHGGKQWVNELLKMLKTM